MSSIANDIILVILAGLLGGIAANSFRQPLIIGYLLAGIFIGPFTPGITVSSPDAIGMLADIGAALLLFTLGLEFPLKTLKPIRRIALWGTLIQVVFTFLAASAFWYGLNRQFMPSLWFGTALLSSSTAVILKTLSNRHLEKSLSGRVMLGMSIIQDLTVIPVMIVIMNWNSVESVWFAPFKPIIIALVFILVMWFIGSRLCSYLFAEIARIGSRELFLMFTLVAGLGVGYLTQEVGISYAFGAFIAGMVISESEYSHKVINDLTPLRDIFGLVFFVSVGMLLEVGFLRENWKLILAVVLSVTFVRGIFLALISYGFGYRRIVPLALLLGMLPISEIAFVLVRMGRQSGAIDTYLYNFILSATVVSMLIGPFLSGLTAPLYRLYLALFFSSSPIEAANFNPEEDSCHPVIIVGNNYIELLSAVLVTCKFDMVIITPVHQAFIHLRKQGIPVIYGAPDQPDILEAAGVTRARMLVAATGNYPENRRIIEVARNLNPDIKTLLQADSAEEAELMTDIKVDEIIIPQREAEVEMLQQTLNHLGVDKRWIVHIRDSVRKLDRSKNINPDMIDKPAAILE
ncbi:MAG: cation:proton antiporter, partial [Victivallaceae bacterium]|nr:cation:proton antiporter [Victivallaceae bacterium]